MPAFKATLVAAAALTSAAACGGDVFAEAAIDVGGGEYAPVVNPADFVTAIDNPFFTLARGSRFVCEGADGEDRQRIEIEVLAGTKTIMGITATVVRDSVFVAGELAEATHYWYAQDRNG